MIVPLPPEPPAPPGSYTPPAGTLVSSVAELEAAWALTSQQTIVLADGVYDRSAHLSTSRGHRLYAQNQGQAVLRFGLTWGGNLAVSGPICQGIRFEVPDPSRCDPLGTGTTEQVVFAWGVSGEGLQLLDCEFVGGVDGGGVPTIGYGVNHQRPNGFVCRRCTFEHFQDGGIRAVQTGSTVGLLLASDIVLEDIEVHDVRRPVPGSANGAAENAIFIGHNAQVRRVLIRDAAWAGIVLANDARLCTLEDVDIDYIGPDARSSQYGPAYGFGIYFEHCRAATLDRFHIGPYTKIGVNCEWDRGDVQDPYQGQNPPRTSFLSVRNGRIESYKLGVHMDRGVAWAQVSRCWIERAWRAAIIDRNTFPDSTGFPPLQEGDIPVRSKNVIDVPTCTFRLPPEVPAVSDLHHGTALLEPPQTWPVGPDDFVDAAMDVREFAVAQEISVGPPSVTVVRPEPGAILAKRSSVEILVEDDAPIPQALVLVRYDGQQGYEVVHDGTAFAPVYEEGQSSREATADGWRYRLRRAGGWPSAPTVVVRAVDRAGAEVVLQ